MFSLKKTKKAYQTPRTAVAEVDLEGLVCTSVYTKVMVDETRNINAEKRDGKDIEPLYFEF